MNQHMWLNITGCHQCTTGIITENLTFPYSCIRSALQKRPLPSVGFGVFDTLFLLKTEETKMMAR